MKSSVASIVVLGAALLSLAACSPPPVDTVQRKTSGDPTPETPRPTPKPPREPWNDARRPLPTGPLGDAQRFLFHVPAFQVTTITENLQNHQKTQGETHVVCGAALWTESMGGPMGRNGVYTDGKREFVYYRGRYEEEPGDADATLDEELKNSTLRRLFDRAEGEIVIVGRETLDGTATAVYRLTSRRDLSPLMRMSVWLAESDHRPLKVEIKENFPNDPRPNAPTARVSTMTYRYDPNVKVTLPAQ